MREIVLDTETTGFNPREGDRIIEIACMEIIDGVITGNSYQIYINPERDVPESSVKVHGITTEFLQGKPLFKDIAQDFLDFIAGDTLIIHNADFDMKFLNFELGLIGKEELYFDRVIDTLATARKKYPGQSNTLDALCDRLSVDRSKRDLHGALIDVDLLAKVYLAMNKKDSTVFNVEQSKQTSSIGYNKDLKESRNFEIPEDDIKNHNEFLEKIKNPIWLN